jgi:hypothetical protein
VLRPRKLVNGTIGCVLMYPTKPENKAFNFKKKSEILHLKFMFEA